MLDLRRSRLRISHSLVLFLTGFSPGLDPSKFWLTRLNIEEAVEQQRPGLVLVLSCSGPSLGLFSNLSSSNPGSDVSKS